MAMSTSEESQPEDKEKLRYHVTLSGTYFTETLVDTTGTEEDAVNYTKAKFAAFCGEQNIKIKIKGARARLVGTPPPAKA